MRLLTVLAATLLGGVCSSAIVSPLAIETEPQHNRLPRPTAVTQHSAPRVPHFRRPPKTARPTRHAGGSWDWWSPRIKSRCGPRSTACWPGVPAASAIRSKPATQSCFSTTANWRWSRRRLKAKAAAVTYRSRGRRRGGAAARARGAQLRTGQENRAANPSEVAQNRYLVEAAAERVKGLEEERKEAELERRAVELRRQNYRSVTPIRGEVAEVSRRRWEYVRGRDGRTGSVPPAPGARQPARCSPTECRRRASRWRERNRGRSFARLPPGPRTTPTAAARSAWNCPTIWCSRWGRKSRSRSRSRSKSKSNRR